MTQTLIPWGSGNGNSLGSGATSYWNPGARSGIATENQASVAWRDAGVFSNLYARVSTNSTTAGNTVITYQDNTVAGNQSLTILHGTTGDFIDNVNTDSPTAGHVIDIKGVGATGGNTSLTLAMQFAPTTTGNVVNKLTARIGVADSSAGTTYYLVPNGGNGTLANLTTESNEQFTNQATATLQNLFVFVSANTLAVATVTSRKNTAAGNLTVSITSGTTGVFEDTSNTDSLAVGDLFNYALNATATTSLTVQTVAATYLTTTGNVHFIQGDGIGRAVAANVTHSQSIQTQYIDNAVGANGAQIQAGIAFTASSLQCYLSANTVTANGTVNWGKGAGVGNQSVTITASTAGFFSDAVHTDSVATTDEITYQVKTGTTGTTSTFTYIGVLAAYANASVTINNWYPAYAAEVIAPPQAAGLSVITQKTLPSPISQADWYGSYPAEVMPRALAAQHSFIAQKILPSPIKQNDFYPDYPAEVLPWAWRAQYSEVAQKKFAMPSLLQWLPVYDPTVEPMPGMARFSDVEQKIFPIASTFIPIGWYPDYDAQVEPAPPRSAFSAIVQRMSAPILILNWLPDYSPDVKPGAFAARHYYFAQTLQAPIPINYWYPAYPAEVKAPPPAAQGYISQLLPTPIRLLPWLPDYDAAIIPFLKNTTALSTPPILPNRIINFLPSYEATVRPAPLAAQNSFVAEKVQPSPITRLDWLPDYAAEVQPAFPRIQYSYIAMLQRRLLLALGAETLIVPLENRTLTPGNDNRQLIVDLENRTLAIGVPS